MRNVRVALVPSGLVPIGASAAASGPTAGPAACERRYEVHPSRIEGQRVLFTASYSAAASEDAATEVPPVPGTFCLVYQARVITAGAYAWEPFVARQVASPGLVVWTEPETVTLR